MNKDVLEFQKKCFANYLNEIRNQVPEIPSLYIYPDGNPIRPVIPVKTVQHYIMLIGAFPSARFEKRTKDGKKYLIPIGDNLSPFGHEEYFDGAEVRTQASRDSLDETYFKQLNIDPNKIWITDIVKVYLFPDKHIKNCEIISPHIKFTNTHKLFDNIALESMNWMRKEILVCNPKLIITLGEVAARTISNDKKTDNKTLLNGQIRPLNLGKEYKKEYKIAHLGHPEIRRINKDWNAWTKKSIRRLQTEISLFI